MKIACIFFIQMHEIRYLHVIFALPGAINYLGRLKNDSSTRQNMKQSFGSRGLEPLPWRRNRFFWRPKMSNPGKNPGVGCRFRPHGLRTPPLRIDWRLHPHGSHVIMLYEKINKMVYVCLWPNVNFICKIEFFINKEKKEGHHHLIVWIFFSKFASRCILLLNKEQNNKKLARLQFISSSEWRTKFISAIFVWNSSTKI